MPHPAVYAVNVELQGAAHSSHSVGIEIKAHQSGSGLFIVADRLGAGPAPGLIVRLRPLGHGHRQLRILSQPVPGPVPDLQIHPGSIAVREGRDRPDLDALVGGGYPIHLLGIGREISQSDQQSLAQAR